MRAARIGRDRRRVLRGARWRAVPAALLFLGAVVTVLLASAPGASASAYPPTVPSPSVGAGSSPSAGAGSSTLPGAGGAPATRSTPTSGHRGARSTHSTQPSGSGPDPAPSSSVPRRPPGSAQGDDTTLPFPALTVLLIAVLLALLGTIAIVALTRRRN